MRALPQGNWKDNADVGTVCQRSINTFKLWIQMSQTCQSLKWKIKIFTPHLSPTRSGRSHLWYTPVALGQNNRQHLSWWFACLSHTRFHIPAKRRQGPRGRSLSPVSAARNSLTHVLAFPLACRISQRRWDLTQLWGNGQKTFIIFLFWVFFLFFSFWGSRLSFSHSRGDRLEFGKHGKLQKEGKTNCFGFTPVITVS